MCISSISIYLAIESIFSSCLVTKGTKLSHRVIKYGCTMRYKVFVSHKRNNFYYLLFVYYFIQETKDRHGRAVQTSPCVRQGYTLEKLPTANKTKSKAQFPARPESAT